MIVEQMIDTDKEALKNINSDYIEWLDQNLYNFWLNMGPYNSESCIHLNKDEYECAGGMSAEFREFLELLCGNGGFIVLWKNGDYTLFWNEYRLNNILEGPAPYLEWQYSNFAEYYRERKKRNDS